MRAGAGLGTWLARAALVALAVLLATGAAAGADAGAGPRARDRAAPARAECVDLVRFFYTMPTSVDADTGNLGAYGTPREDSGPFDQDLLVTYCRQGDTWAKTADAMPYDSPTLCLNMQLSEDPMPVEIRPVDAIGDFYIEGVNEPQGSGLRYCRSGDGWLRPRQDGDPPASPPGEECMTVTRWVLVPPQTITPPKTPEDFGRRFPTMDDERFHTTYCLRSGIWKLTADAFPYDAAAECVTVLYDPDKHGGHAPPDDVASNEEIDGLGHIDVTGGGTGQGAILEEYCRQGSGWHRTARADDYPAGRYTEWRTGDCKTVRVQQGPDERPPRRLTEDPSTIGDPDIAGIPTPELQRLNPKDLPTYCPRGSVWFRVDDYPFEQVDPRLKDLLSVPDQGAKCVVLREPIPGWPEKLDGFQDPRKLWHFSIAYPGARYDVDGTYLGNWTDGPGGAMVNYFDPQHSYCFVNGVWRRGDKITGCDTDEVRTRRQGLVPDECWGPQPTGNYDIGYDNGGLTDMFSSSSDIGSVGSRLTGWWTDAAFHVGKLGTQISLWVVDWAYSFDLTKYNSAGLAIGSDYEKNLTMNPGFHLYEFAWLALVAWAGITALRGKISMAGGEIVMSILLVMLSMQLMTHRLEYMNATWRLMDAATIDILVAGQGKDPATGSEQNVTQVIDDVQSEIHNVFVEQPYDYINWGHTLDRRCAETRNAIVALGPHGTADGPRDMMKDAGCAEEAEFNAKPTMTRLLAAVFSGASSVVVSSVLLAVALTVVLAKFMALVLFATAPFAALAAILPGGSRRLAWLWLTSLIQSVAAVIGMGLVLSLLLLGIHHLLAGMVNVGLAERFFVMMLAVIAIAVARRRLLSSTEGSIGRLSDNLTNMRLGGGGPAWVGPSGSRGVNFLGIDRAMNNARAARRAAVGQALTFGGQVVAMRLHERRLGRRFGRALRRSGGGRPVRYPHGGPGQGGRGGGPALPLPGPGLPRGGGPLPGGGVPRPGGGVPRPGGGGARPGGSVTQGGHPSPLFKASEAAYHGDKNLSRYWKGVHHAESTYRSDMRLAGHSYERQIEARDNYRSNMEYTRKQYDRGVARQARRAERPTAPRPAEQVWQQGARVARPNPVSRLIGRTPAVRQLEGRWREREAAGHTPLVSGVDEAVKSLNDRWLNLRARYSRREVRWTRPGSGTRGRR